MVFKFTCIFSKREEDEQQLGLISETPIVTTRNPSTQPPTTLSDKHSPATSRKVSIRVSDKSTSEDDGCHLTIPKLIAGSSSAETLTGLN